MQEWRALSSRGSAERGRTSTVFAGARTDEHNVGSCKDQCKDFCQCDRKHSRTLLAAALMSSALSGHSPHELRTSGCTEGSKQGMICGSVKEIKCASEASQPEAGVNSCIREGSRTKNIEERMQIVTSRREGVVCNA
eukprot:scaffold139788_cov20-Tisochrysis_lutea.AAC.2